MTDVPEWLAIPRPEEIYHEPVHDGPCNCDAPTWPARSRSSTHCILTRATSRTRALPRTNAPAITQTALEHRLPQRLLEHEQGRGARLTQVQWGAGGTWRLASVEPGGADRERQLKQHSAARRCPICKAEAVTATAARWQQATSPQPEPQVRPGPQIHPELDAELEPG